MKKKKIEPKCKNCKLFDEQNGLCKVVILHEGEKINLPVEKNDDCFFENEFIAKDGEKFKVEVNQVKFWVEDPVTGEKTDKDGRVMMEYPKDFFGKKNDE